MSRNKLSVSVAMAAYNGDRYIKSQIETIMCQLKESDELVISLDPSTDATEQIIRDFAKKDSRIHFLYGKGEGLVCNFSNAIRHCKNDIIFLCDQDDLWKEDKVECILSYFHDTSVEVVMHDAEIINENNECLNQSFMDMRGCRTGILKNILKNSYIGCCMAFRKELRKYILPFPENIPMHDQWIGLIGEITGKNVMIHKQLIGYRRHGQNVSSESHAGFFQMLSWRICLISNLLKFYLKFKKFEGRKEQ